MQDPILNDANGVSNPPVPSSNMQESAVIEPLATELPANNLAGLTGEVPAQTAPESTPAEVMPIDSSVEQLPTLSTQPTDQPIEPMQEVPQAQPEISPAIPAPSTPIEPVEQLVVSAPEPIAVPEPAVMPEQIQVAPPIDNTIPSEVAPIAEPMVQTTIETTSVVPVVNTPVLNVPQEISTPVIENPVSAMNEVAATPILPFEQNVPAAPEVVAAPVTAQPNVVSTEVNPELSSIFESIPSEISVPSVENKTVVPTDLGNPTPVGPLLVSGLPPIDMISVNNQPGKTNGGIVGVIVRFIIWFVILVLGVVSLILGVYFAQLINIPFLDPIFRR